MSSVDRITRVNALLRQEIGEALYHVLGSSDLDLSAITVTAVAVSRDLRTARVRVSFLGHEQERRRMLAALQRRRAAVQSLLNKDLYLRYTPRLTFEYDPSLEKGDRMLGLLAQMEQQAEAAPQQGSAPDPGEDLP